MEEKNIFQDLIDKVVVIDNTIILEEIKLAKSEGYKFLLVEHYIGSDFEVGGKDNTSIVSSYKFYKANYIHEFYNKTGTIYELERIICV